MITLICGEESDLGFTDDLINSSLDGGLDKAIAPWYDGKHGESVLFTLDTE